jgi:hypothetical protein
MWNPPSGAVPGEPMRPGDSRRAVEDAIAAARERDRQLREEIGRLAAARVVAAGDVAAARSDAAEARTLAGRALVRADESAREGQRADAARWTNVARVFAMRGRDARARVAEGERLAAAAAEQRRRAEAGLAANAGALDAAAAAHLAALSGRRAARLQAEVDATVAEVASPAAELVHQAEQTALAALEAEAAAPADAAATEPVPVDALEDELDLESVDPLLDELRAELGLGAVPPPAAARGTAPAGRR